MSEKCGSKFFETGDEKQNLDGQNGDYAPGKIELLLKKLNPILISFSTYPLYILILIIASESELLSNIVPIPLILGLFATFELFDLLLLNPPRRYKNGLQLETIVLPEEDDFNEFKGKIRRIEIFHCFTLLFSIWAFNVSCSKILREILSPSNYNLYSLIGIIISLLVLFTVFKEVGSHRWMNKYSNSTIWISIILQIASTFTLVIGAFIRSEDPKTSGRMFFIGALIMLANAMHMRFAYLYKNPLRGENLLTIKSTRLFMKKWFLWFVLMDCVIWSSIPLLVFGTSGDIEFSPKSLFWIILTFCVLTVICLFSKIVYFHKSPKNVETRFFMKKWYLWFLLINCVIWSSIPLYVIGKVGNVVFSPNSLFWALLTFCVFTIFSFFAKIVYCCYKKIRTTEYSVVTV